MLLVALCCFCSGYSGSRWLMYLFLCVSVCVRIINWLESEWILIGKIIRERERRLQLKNSHSELYFQFWKTFFLEHICQSRWFMFVIFAMTTQIWLDGNCQCHSEGVCTDQLTNHLNFNDDVRETEMHVCSWLFNLHLNAFQPFSFATRGEGRGEREQSDRIEQFYHLFFTVLLTRIFPIECRFHTCLLLQLINYLTFSLINPISFCLQFLETLSEGLERVLFIRGAGREVITIYS